MTLVKCLECGDQVSDRAASCPKCGAPAGKRIKPVPVQRKALLRGVAAAVGLLLAAVLAVRLTSLDSSDRHKAIDAVSSALVTPPSGLNISGLDLKTALTPQGNGVLVYVGQGAPQALWAYWDNRAYWVNGLSKSLTPSLPEANREELRKHGIQGISEGLKLTYGS